MSEVIIEISIYLILAILLGYTFGWLIAKAMSKKRNSNDIDGEELEVFKEEYLQAKRENSELLSENNKILLENSEQKLKTHNLEKELQERELLIKSKDDEIRELKRKLLKQEKSHELEMIAFIEEREELIKKWQPSKN
ncbi:MAG: hypothetical protein DSZ07_02010 [Sulfurovum sp.]|nr:MAG: hypothetical protein DSZ07_02010 [Sulfurovum sp.]